MVWKTCGNSSNYERIKFLSGTQDRIAAAGDEDKPTFINHGPALSKFILSKIEGVERFL